MKHICVLWHTYAYPDIHMHIFVTVDYRRTFPPTHPYIHSYTHTHIPVYFQTQTAIPFLILLKGLETLMATGQCMYVYVCRACNRLVYILLCIYVCIYVCMSPSRYFCEDEDPEQTLSVCLSIHVSACLSVCLLGV